MIEYSYEKKDGKLIATKNKGRLNRHDLLACFINIPLPNTKQGFKKPPFYKGVFTSDWEYKELCKKYPKFIRRGTAISDWKKKYEVYQEISRGEKQ